MPENSSNSSSFKKFYAISLAWQLGFLISFAMLGFSAIGYFIDQRIGTFPFLSIVGLVVGIVTSIIEIYHMLIPIINNHAQH